MCLAILFLTISPRDKKYRDLLHAGKITVMAGFYDFKGEFGKGMGNIIIVNVNM